MEVAGDAGLEVFDVGEGTGVKKLKTGVVPASVPAGEENPEGVEACSVANRSEVGTALGVNSPHPSMKNNAAVSPIRLKFFMIPARSIQDRIPRLSVFLRHSCRNRGSGFFHPLDGIC